MGGTVGRIVGDVATGGLAEFARPDSFGIPAGLAGPAKQIGLGVGGAMLGGPAGGMLGGSLGSLLAGNPQLAGILGGAGAGGLLAGGLGGAAGGGLLGAGLGMNTDVGNVNFPNQQQDAQSITDEEDSLRKLFGQQNDQYGQLAQSQRDNLMRQLTTGQEGEAFRQKYNNLGLLNSGAFNQGLSNQFGNLAAQQQQDILGQNVQQTGQLANLDQSKLSRQFGLEDQQTQFSLAKAIQEAQQKSQLQQSLIGGGSYLLGGGAGGGGGGAAPAGGGGNMFGGMGDMLTNILSKFRQPVPKGMPMTTPFPQGQSQMNMPLFGSPQYAGLV